MRVFLFVWEVFSICEWVLPISINRPAVGPSNAHDRWQPLSLFFVLFFSYVVLCFPAHFSLLSTPLCLWFNRPLPRIEKFLFQYIFFLFPAIFPPPCNYSNHFLSLRLGFTLSPFHYCFDMQLFCSIAFHSIIWRCVELRLKCSHQLSCC